MTKARTNKNYNLHLLGNFVSCPRVSTNSKHTLRYIFHHLQCKCCDVDGGDVDDSCSDSDDGNEDGEGDGDLVLDIKSNDISPILLQIDAQGLHHQLDCPTLHARNIPS